MGDLTEQQLSELHALVGKAWDVANEISARAESLPAVDVLRQKALLLVSDAIKLHGMTGNRLRAAREEG